MREICLATCSADSDCSPPYDECLAMTRQDAARTEVVKVCVNEQLAEPDDLFDEDCQPTGDCCRTHKECADLFEDEAARCGADARCFIPRQ